MVCERGRGATLHYHVVRKLICWFERLQKRSARHLFLFEFYTCSFFRTVLHVAEVVPYLTRQLMFIIYVGSNLVNSCVREPVHKEHKNRSLISLSINLCFHSTSPVINIHTTTLSMENNILCLTLRLNFERKPPESLWNSSLIIVFYSCLSAINRLWRNASTCVNTYTDQRKHDNAPADKSHLHYPSVPDSVLLCNYISLSCTVM